MMMVMDDGDDGDGGDDDGMMKMKMVNMIAFGSVVNAFTGAARRKAEARQKESGPWVVNMFC